MNRAQARKHAKFLKKQMQSYNPEPGLVEWNTYNGPAAVEVKEQKIPGLDIPPVPEYHTEMVNKNKWFDIEQLQPWIDTIKTLAVDDPYEADGNTLKPGCTGWSWSKNLGCKYVDIRIDMRDGGFVVLNREGERICLEQLKWQYVFKDER